jgi:beta-lactamase regulating signal transducer with metallopeptidase domain
MSLLEAFLNTLWPAAAGALAVWLVLRLLGRINAATRGAIWWAVLGYVVLLPLARQLTPPSAYRAPVTTATASFDFRQQPPVAERIERVQTVSPPAAPVTVRARSWPAVLAGVWILCAAVQCLRLAWSFVWLCRLKRQAVPAPDAAQAVLVSWIQHCGIRRPVRLLVSAGTPMPVAVGFFHPAVILPAELLESLSSEELDHVLLHELAHLARRDDWTLLASRAAAAVLALNPVARFVLAQIERHREMACDDWVVAATGSPRPYARSLARLFELCVARPRVQLAPGLADGGSSLGDRISMLLGRGREFHAETSLLRVVACIVVMSVLLGAAMRTPAWIAVTRGAPRRPYAISTRQAVYRSPVQPRFATSIRRGPNQVRPMSAAACCAAAQPSLLAALVEAGYGDLSVDDIILLKNRGITPDFLDGMKRAGWGKRSPAELIDLRSNGVRPEYVGQIAALGYTSFSARDFVDLARNGVSADLFRGLKEAGFTQLTAATAIAAQRAGLRPEHLREAHKYGPKLTLDQILRLKQAGVL